MSERGSPREITGVGYGLTYVALLGLATASVALSFLRWSTGAVAVSLAIAAVKALLVALVFMHLVGRSFASRAALALGAAFVALLAGLTTVDVASRHTSPARPVPSAHDPFYLR
jgi:cytochrome c oxidase subunit 4